MSGSNERPTTPMVPGSIGDLIARYGLPVESETPAPPAPMPTPPPAPVAPGGDLIGLDDLGIDDPTPTAPTAAPVAPVVAPAAATITPPLAVPAVAPLATTVTPPLAAPATSRATTPAAPTFGAPFELPPMPTPFAAPSVERLPGAPSDAAASEISAAVAAAAELIARAGQNEAQRAEAERAAIAAEREAIEQQRQTAETIIRQQQAAADATLAARFEELKARMIAAEEQARAAEARAADARLAEAAAAAAAETTRRDAAAIAAERERLNTQAAAYETARAQQQREVETERATLAALRSELITSVQAKAEERAADAEGKLRGRLIAIETRERDLAARAEQFVTIETKLREGSTSTAEEQSAAEALRAKAELERDAAIAALRVAEEERERSRSAAETAMAEVATIRAQAAAAAAEPVRAAEATIAAEGTKSEQRLADAAATEAEARAKAAEAALGALTERVKGIEAQRAIDAERLEQLTDGREVLNAEIDRARGEREQIVGAFTSAGITAPMSFSAPPREEPSLPGIDELIRDPFADLFDSAPLILDEERAAESPTRINHAGIIQITPPKRTRASDRRGNPLGRAIGSLLVIGALIGVVFGLFALVGYMGENNIDPVRALTTIVDTLLKGRPGQ